MGFIVLSRLFEGTAAFAGDVVSVQDVQTDLVLGSVERVYRPGAPVFGGYPVRTHVEPVIPEFLGSIISLQKYQETWANGRQRFLAGMRSKNSFPSVVGNGFVYNRPEEEMVALALLV